jgi:hypothetical protein
MFAMVKLGCLLNFRYTRFLASFDGGLIDSFDWILSEDLWGGGQTSTWNASRLPRVRHELAVVVSLLYLFFGCLMMMQQEMRV